MVDDATEVIFRKAAMAQFGYEKGSLSKAADVAFGQWAAQRKFPADELKEHPVLYFEGILKHVKKSSVELQHEARKAWGKHVRS